MFTQTVEYALRAIVHLAQQSPAASTTEDVADATHVPRAYLAKILSGLRRSGLVKSQRGLGGGISLSRPPEELTILDGECRGTDRTDQNLPLGFVGAWLEPLPFALANGYGSGIG